MIKPRHYLLCASLLGALSTTTSLPVTVFASEQATDSSSVEMLGGNAPEFTVDKSGAMITPSYGFGSHAITGFAQSLTPVDNVNRADTADTYTGDQLSITDNSGTGYGYSVNAKLLEIVSDNGHKLPGASLTLDPQKPVRTDTGTPSVPEVYKKTLVNGGADEKIMFATQDTGMGTYSSDMSRATLDVPNTDYADDYKGVIQYTVEASPKPPATIPDDAEYSGKIGTADAYIKEGILYILDGDMTYNKVPGKNVIDFVTQANNKGIAFNTIDTTLAQNIQINRVNSDPNNPVGEFASLPENIKTLNIPNINVSGSKDLSAMFVMSNGVETINVDNWDTSNVVNMFGMFAMVPELRVLDLGNWDTSNVTSFSMMFANSPKIQALNLQSFNTSKATDMSTMFAGTSSLESLDLSSFNTENVKNMTEMFQNSGVRSLNLSNFRTNSLTSSVYMFNGANRLSELDLRNFNFAPDKLFNMFSDMPALTKLNIENLDISNTTDFASMFRGDTNLVRVVLPKTTPQKVDDIESMFQDTPNLDGDSLLPILNKWGVTQTTKQNNAFKNSNFTQYPSWHTGN